MADTDTQTPNTADAIARLYQQLMAQPAPTIPSGTPDDGASPSWTGLLGRALSGGQAPGYQLRGGEADTSGNRALLNFGINTLLASGPHAVRPDLLSSVATGLQGAQESLGQDQSRAGALAAAQFQAQREGRQDQLARIKEAIPVLQLMQKNESIRGMPGSLLGGGGSNTSTGNAGATSGTFFDALAQIESGDANIVSRVDKDSQGKTLAQGGNPDEISQGHYQINPDTWRRYAKQAGVDPSQFPNPMKAPKEVQAQVASVIPLSAFGPRTQKLLRQRFGDLDTNQTIGALAGARAAPSTPGTAAAAPPKAAPGQAPAPKAGGIQVAPEPPLATTAPAQTAQGPEEGTVQVAGGGAPTSGVIPTLPPTLAARSAADVADINAGVANAQATPLVHQPGAVVTAQAGGPPVLPPGMDPNSREAFGIMHPIIPTEAEKKLFNTAPDPEQLANVRTKIQNLNQQYQDALRQRDPAAVAKTREALDTALTAENTLRENARKLGVDTEAKFYEQRRAALDAAHAAEVAQRNKDADAARTQANALELARANADFDKDKEGARIAMRGDEKRMQDHATAAAAMQPVSDQLRQLPALMQNLPPGGSLSSLMGQFPQVASLLEKANIVSPGTADNVSIFMGLTNHLAGQLRVTGSGSMSDKDLASFKTVMPQLLQSPEGRLKAVAFLQNIADRVVEAQEFTNSYFKRIDPKTGKPAHDLVHLKDAINAPRRLDENGINQGGLGPVVPAAPKFEGPGSYAAAREWLKANTQSGRPYTAWLPNEKGELTQQIMVAE